MSKIKVMIVDDNEFMRDMVSAILVEDDDIEIVAELSDGVNISVMIQEKKPDVILLDMIMPYMNGVTVVEYINDKKDKFEKVPKIIVVSANSQKGVMDKAFRLGVSDYIIKPFDSNDLIKKIKENCN